MAESINKMKFLAAYDAFVCREGADKLREWLIGSDFFTAPASSKYHGAIPEGLCIHSLAVRENFDHLRYAFPGINVNGETAVIVSLLHDVCKIDYYKPDFRNVKKRSRHLGESSLLQH